MSAGKMAVTSATPPVILRFIQWGVLALVAVMPFHAFLSVWLGHLVGHQALWQSWKEVLLVLMAGGAAWLTWRQPERLQRLRQPALIAAGVFVLIALIVTAVTHPHLTAAVYGLKTDCEFLLAFVLAWLVADSGLVSRATQLLLVTSGVVIAFGLLQIYVLPAGWLTHFGYGPQTIQPYELVDPAVKAVRIISTLGGPNQLGSFLILPLAVVTWQLLRNPRWWQALYLLGGLIVLWHSYSRSAVLGLAAAIVILIVLRLPRYLRLPALLLATLLLAVGLQLAINDSGRSSKLQYYLFHQTINDTGIVASTAAHAAAVNQGVSVALQHPWGLGLGSAGPASFHSRQAIIPENYYLQLAIETGVAGLLAFIVMEILVGWQLWQRSCQVTVAAPLLITMVGMAIVNLFLHGWADSSTALVYWSLAGGVLGLAGSAA